MNWNTFKLTRASSRYVWRPVALLAAGALISGRETSTAVALKLKFHAESPSVGSLIAKYEKRAGGVPLSRRPRGPQLTARGPLYPGDSRISSVARSQAQADRASEPPLSSSISTKEEFRFAPNEEADANAVAPNSATPESSDAAAQILAGGWNMDINTHYISLLGVDRHTDMKKLVEMNRNFYTRKRQNDVAGTSKLELEWGFNLKKEGTKYDYYNSKHNLAYLARKNSWKEEGLPYIDRLTTHDIDHRTTEMYSDLDHSPRLSDLKMLLRRHYLNDHTISDSFTPEGNLRPRAWRKIEEYRQGADDLEAIPFNLFVNLQGEYANEVLFEGNDSIIESLINECNFGTGGIRPPSGREMRYFPHNFGVRRFQITVPEGFVNTETDFGEFKKILAHYPKIAFTVRTSQPEIVKRLLLSFPDEEGAVPSNLVLLKDHDVFLDQEKGVKRYFSKDGILGIEVGPLPRMINKVWDEEMRSFPLYNERYDETLRNILTVEQFRRIVEEEKVELKEMSEQKILEGWKQRCKQLGLNFKFKEPFLSIKVYDYNRWIELYDSAMWIDDKSKVDIVLSDYELSQHRSSLMWLDPNSTPYLKVARQVQVLIVRKRAREYARNPSKFHDYLRFDLDKCLKQIRITITEAEAR